MEFNTIAPEVKKKNAKRVGRGIGSGNGKTAGRGLMNPPVDLLYSVGCAPGVLHAR